MEQTHFQLCQDSVTMVAVTQERETEDRTSDLSSGTRRMMNEKQVLGIVPVSRTTLYRMEKAGRFPRSTYISANRRVWFEDEIAAWQGEVDERNPARGRGKGRRRRVAS
jgi:prophage regulatory protein